jgi:hypothetical protein
MTIRSSGILLSWDGQNLKTQTKENSNESRFVSN